MYILISKSLPVPVPVPVMYLLCYFSSTWTYGINQYGARSSAFDRHFKGKPPISNFPTSRGDK